MILKEIHSTNICLFCIHFLQTFLYTAANALHDTIKEVYIYMYGMGHKKVPVSCFLKSRFLAAEVEIT